MVWMMICFIYACYLIGWIGLLCYMFWFAVILSNIAGIRNELQGLERFEMFEIVSFIPCFDGYKKIGLFHFICPPVQFPATNPP